jgi:AraC-like DNA-binding protein
MLFKSQTGTNFAAFYREMRIQRAKRLLTETAESINEIAFELGYDAVKAVCRDFRRVVGCPATQFRSLRSNEKVGRTSQIVN